MLLSSQIVITLSMILVGLFVVITRLRFVTFLLTNAIVSRAFLTFIKSFAKVIVSVHAILLATRLFSRTFSCMPWRRGVNERRDS